MAEQCAYYSPFDGWRCPEEATTIEGVCIFHHPSLNKDVSLLKARFEARLADEKEDPLRFDGAIFPEEISFKGVTFKRSVSFFGAGFYGRWTSFAETQFHGRKTFFITAEFHSQWTSFAKAGFYGQEVSFDGAKFLGQGTSFVEAQFHGLETSFRAAQFHGEETLFHETQFHGQKTSFAIARFHGRTIFRGWEPKEVFHSGETDFTEIRFGEKGKLVFDWVDLSRTRFLHADLSRVKFLDVTWDHQPDWKLVPLQRGVWRSRVYDETLWREMRRDPKTRGAANTGHLSHLGRLYRALKAYYREAGEHHLVSHFHYGLMEVQWHQKRK